MRLDTALGLDLNRLEVDFHLPDLERDAHLAVDPFLMFKSRHEKLRDWHALILRYFEKVISHLKINELDLAVSKLLCPEPREVRLGYASGTMGRGIGPTLARDVCLLISSNTDLLARDFRHLEELQLYSVGIGEDRLSDLVVSVLKAELIQYTQQQAALWAIPLVPAVGISNVWMDETAEWSEVICNLPVDPETGEAVILIPRRVLRRLPWINFEDFRRNHLLSFLPNKNREISKTSSKKTITRLTVTDLSLVDRYVGEKESTAYAADPIDLDQRDKAKVEADSLALEKELSELPSGTANGKAYETLVLRTLNMVLEPHLIDGRPQQRTESGTQIRDIIFVNDSDHSFWDYVRARHMNLLVVFEIKNKDVLVPADLNQLHAYLGDSVGYLGFVVSRKGFRQTDLNRAHALYNRREPRSVLLSLSDNDLGFTRY